MQHLGENGLLELVTIVTWIAGVLKNAAETLSYSASSGTQQKMELHRSTPRQNGQ